MKEKNVKIGLKIGKIGNLAFARRRVLKKRGLKNRMSSWNYKFQPCRLLFLFPTSSP